MSTSRFTIWWIQREINILLSYQKRCGVDSKKDIEKLRDYRDELISELKAS